MSEDAHARDTVELVAWILLAAATVLSAWCAYQASLWSGEQNRGVAKAGVAQFASMRKTGVANRDLTIDAATFVNYLEADLRGESDIANYLRGHARPEFRAAFDAWLRDRAAGHGEDPLPFLRPEYHLKAVEEAASLDAQAAHEIAEANAANAHGDLYVLHTVMFALALFFLGGVSQVRGRGVRNAALAFGAFICVAAAISAARLPRARPERHGGGADGKALTQSRP
jgi:hypothetical protein